jgi:hypothetical protein
VKTGGTNARIGEAARARKLREKAAAKAAKKQPSVNDAPRVNPYERLMNKLDEANGRNKN